MGRVVAWVVAMPVNNIIVEVCLCQSHSMASNLGNQYAQKHRHTLHEF